MKTVKRALAVLTTISFASLAHAQNGDGGVNGANRRVTATGGYGGVRATFTEPTFVVDYPGTDYSQHLSRPDIYTGLKYGLTVEMDAGVAWVNQQYVTSNNQVYVPSWKCYLRITDGPLKDPAHPLNGIEQPMTYIDSSGGTRSWRADRGSLGRFVLNCSVQPSGDVVLNVRQDSPTATSPNGATDSKPVRWPRNRDGTITKAVVTGMSAKRVVAITQKGIKYGVPGDGREINSIGTAVEEAQVARVTKNASGDLVLSSTWADWSDASHVSYFLPRERYLDTSGRPTGPFVIDLQDNHKRDANGAPTNPSTMWNAETVDIRLMKGATGIGGRRAKKGKRNRNRRPR